HVASLTVTQVVTLDNSSDAARPGRTGPDDVVVDRIWSGPTTLTTSNCVPGTSRNVVTTRHAAWSTIRWIILLVSVDVVRNPIIDRDVIHLRDRQLNAIPRATTSRGYRDAAIVRDCHTIRVRRIYP